MSAAVVLLAFLVQVILAYAVAHHLARGRYHGYTFLEDLASIALATMIGALTGALVAGLLALNYYLLVA